MKPAASRSGSDFYKHVKYIETQCSTLLAFTFPHKLTHVFGVG